MYTVTLIIKLVIKIKLDWVEIAVPDYEDG